MMPDETVHSDESERVDDATATAPKFMPQHMERLRVRAIDPDLAFNEGARSFDEDAVRAEVKNPKLIGAALVYSYAWITPPRVDFVGYIRAYLDEREQNGKKTVVPRGKTPPPYFLSTAEGHEGPWVIVESCEKALALKSNGIDEPVGLGGTDAGLFVKVGEVRALHPLFTHFVKPDHRIYLLMDAGRAANPRVALAEARMSRALRHYGCDVRLVGLPPAEGGLDQGPDDFLFANGAAALHAVFEQTEPGDPVERANAAASGGPRACEALLHDLPFLAAVYERGNHDDVRAALGQHVASDALDRALEEFRSGLRGETVFDRGDEVELAVQLVDDLGGRDVLVFDEGDFYRYQSGVWRPLSRDEAKRVVSDYAGAKVRAAKGLRTLTLADRAVAGTVNLARAQVTRRDFFSRATRGLAFLNGFLRIHRDTVELVPHDPGHRARHRYDFEYDPDATAPTFTGYLDSVWLEDPDAAAKRTVVQEYLGACLFGFAARSKRVLLLVGDGDSGKSTLLNVIDGVMRPGSVTHIPPQQFRSDYHRAQLAGALVNTVAEVAETEWMDPATFKALVGDDKISARSPYKDVITFRPVAGHVLAANAPPRINDRSAATWNRLIVVTFTRTFVRAGDGRAGTPARADLAEAVVRDEVPGVVAWAVAGARRLLANGLAYTRIASSAAAVSALRAQSDQLASFVTEQCEIDPEARTVKRQVYERYVQWARATNHSVLSSTNFGREFMPLLRRLTGLQDPCSTNHQGRQVYVGVRLAKLTVDELPRTIGVYERVIGESGYPETVTERDGKKDPVQ